LSCNLAAPSILRIRNRATGEMGHTITARGLLIHENERGTGFAEDAGSTARAGMLRQVNPSASGGMANAIKCFWTSHLKGT